MQSLLILVNAQANNLVQNDIMEVDGLIALAKIIVHGKYFPLRGCASLAKHLHTGRPW